MKETPFKQALHYRAGRRAEVDLYVVHSTEGTELPNAAEATQDYFTHIDREASAHAVTDQDSIVFCVHFEDTAFHAAHVNDRSYGIEQCGKAGQTAQQWDDLASHATVFNTAKLIARGIREETPWVQPVWLLAADLKRLKAAGQPFNGITSHAEVEAAFPSTGHWDPGPNYPHDKLIAAIKDLLNPPAPTPPVDEDKRMLGRISKRPASTAPAGTPKKTVNGVELVDDGAVFETIGRGLVWIDGPAAKTRKIDGAAVTVYGYGEKEFAALPIFTQS